MRHAVCAGRPEWTSGRPDDTAQALQACRTCPALDPCRDHASRFTWNGVTVAAWTAPDLTPRRPPWAPPIRPTKRKNQP